MDFVDPLQLSILRYGPSNNKQQSGDLGIELAYDIPEDVPAQNPYTAGWGVSPDGFFLS